MTSSKSSVDIKELKKFAKTYHDWWDKDGEFKTLHEINPSRIEFIKNTAIDHFNLSAQSNQPFKDLSLIDVGCGGGLISVPMHNLGTKTTGLDANESNVVAANEYATKNNLQIEFIHSTVEECVEKPNKYNIVLCLEVIEHVANPEEFIGNLSKLLKPGGLLIMSTLNRNIKSYGLAIFMAEKILKLMPRGTHDYAKFVKPSELSKMASNAHLNINSLKGIEFSIVSRRWKLTDNLDVNYLASYTN